MKISKFKMLPDFLIQKIMLYNSTPFADELQAKMIQNDINNGMFLWGRYENINSSYLLCCVQKKKTCNSWDCGNIFCKKKDCLYCSGYEKCDTCKKLFCEACYCTYGEEKMCDDCFRAEIELQEKKEQEEIWKEDFHYFAGGLI